MYIKWIQRLTRHPHFAKVFGRATVATAAQLASMAATICLSVILADKLSLDGFGAYGYLVTLGATSAGLTGLGLGATLIRYIPALRETDKAGAGELITTSYLLTWIFSVITAGVLYLFASSRQGGPSGLTPTSILFTAIIVVPTSLTTLQQSILAGLDQFTFLSITVFIRSLVQLTLCGGGAASFGLDGTLAGLFATLLITAAVNEAQIRKCTRPQLLRYSHFTFRPNLSLFHRFSLPAYLSAVVNSPSQQLTNEIILHRPDGLGAIALLNVGYQWRNAFLLFPSILGQVALPTLASGQFNPEAQAKALKLLATGGFILICGSATMLYGFPFILTTLYRGRLEGVQTIIPIIGFATAINAVATSIGHYFMLNDGMWRNVAFNAVQIAALVLSSLLLVQRMEDSAAAIAVAYVIAYSIQLILMLLMWKKQRRSKNAAGTAS